VPLHKLLHVESQDPDFSVLAVSQQHTLPLSLFE
jgi:hypothetical protein